MIAAGVAIAAEQFIVVGGDFELLDCQRIQDLSGCLATGNDVLAHPQMSKAGGELGEQLIGCSGRALYPKYVLCRTSPIGGAIGRYADRPSLQPFLRPP